MAAQSYEIGTLLQSIQAKGQAKSSNYQTQRQSYEPEMIKSQEKVQDVSNATQIVSSLISTGVNVYAKAKQQAIETKNKNDLAEGALSLGELGLDVTKTLNDDNNKGLLKYTDDGDIDIGNSQELYDNYIESISSAGYSDEVTESLISQADESLLNTKNQALNLVMKKEQQRQATLIATSLDNAIVTDSDLSNINSPSQVDKVLDSFKDVLSSEQLESYRVNAKGIVAENRGVSVASTIGITEGKSSAYNHIASDPNITDKATARSTVDQNIENAKYQIDTDIKKAYEKYPRMFVNGSLVIDYNDAISKAKQEYKDSSPELQDYAVSKIKEYQADDVAKLGVFKSDDQYDLMQTNEVKLAKIEMQKYADSGVLVGMDKTIASNKVKINDILKESEEEATTTKKESLFKSADLLKYTSKDDITKYGETLKTSYENGEITDNEYAKQLNLIDTELGNRETDSKNNIKDSFLNKSQLSLMDKDQLVAYKSQLKEEEEKGTFKGMEKDLADLYVNISGEITTKETLAANDLEAKEKAEADEKQRALDLEEAKLELQVKTQKKVIADISTGLIKGDITPKESLIRLDVLKDNITDLDVAKSYKSILSQIINGDENIPETSKVLVNNLLDNLDIDIKKSLNYADADAGEKPEKEFNELKQYATAYIMDKYLNYDGSISQTEFFNSMKDDLNVMVNTKLYDGKSLKTSDADIKESKALVFYDDKLGTYNFASEKIKERYNKYEKDLNTELEKEGIEVDSSIPAIPRLDEFGNVYANPILTDKDGVRYSIEGKDLMYLDRDKNTWVKVNKEKVKKAGGLKSFFKNIQWGVQ